MKTFFHNTISTSHKMKCAQLKTSALLLAVSCGCMTSATYAANVNVDYTSTGLDGNSSLTRKGGNGESVKVGDLFAKLANTAQSSSLNISQTAQGGKGGDGAIGGGKGGNGEDTLSLNNKTAAKTTISVNSNGGLGGTTDSRGSGGKGGNGTAQTSIKMAGNGNVSADANGGTGGTSYLGNGGKGGKATAKAKGTTSASVGSQLNVTAQSVGGHGGIGFGTGSHGGRGQTSQATARGIATNGANLSVTAIQAGGTGGSGYNGANAADGANSIMRNAVSGSTSGNLSLYQLASGGNGGDSNTGKAGNGGNAVSVLTVTDHSADALLGVVQAYGGAGGNTFSSPWGSNGNALAQVNLTSSALQTIVTAYATASAPKARAQALATTKGVGVDAYVSSTATATGKTGLAKAQTTVSDNNGNSFSVTALAPMNNGSATAWTGNNDGGYINNGLARASGSLSKTATSSLGSANAAFTVVGSSDLGAISNGGSGAYKYVTEGSYTFSLTSGNDLFLNLTKSTEYGSGFNSATLTVTENNKSVINKNFSSYANFLSFLDTPTDLGTASGNTTVSILLTEMLSGSGNGQITSYQLAIAQSGTVTGQYNTASAVPLPSSLPLFVTALLGIVGISFFRTRKTKTSA